MSIESTIASTFTSVRDPLTQLSCLDLDIHVSVNEQSIQLVAGFPCQSFFERVRPLIAAALPGYNIALAQEIKSHRTQLTGQHLRGIKNTIAIASGKGGVGKSTVTVQLAYALAHEGARVGILDADIYGPSIPTMLGNTNPVIIEEDHYIPVQAHGIQAMSIGYLTQDDSALIWRGPMLAKTLIHMIDLTRWDNLDYLLIDLPPGTGDIQLSLVQKIPLSGAIIVTTPQTVATKDAQKALNLFSKTNIDVIGLIENMSLHTCRQCGHQEPLFGQGGAMALCRTTNTPFLGQLPLTPSIGDACDQGTTLSDSTSPEWVAFQSIALKATASLASRPLNYSSKFPPIVVE